MDKETFKTRLKEQVAVHDFEMTEEQLEDAATKYLNKLPPSLAVKKLKPKSTLRADRRKKAKKDFGLVLDECLETFNLEEPDLDVTADEITNDIRDLRSMACQLAVERKIEPMIYVAETLYLTTPAMAYHAAKRGRELEEKSVLYKEKLDEIRELLPCLNSDKKA